MFSRKKPAAAKSAGKKAKPAKGKQKPVVGSKRRDSAEWVDILEILDILDGK